MTEPSRASGKEVQDQEPSGDRGLGRVTRPTTALNAAQNKCVNFLKTL